MTEFHFLGELLLTCTFLFSYLFFYLCFVPSQWSIFGVLHTIWVYFDKSLPNLQWVLMSLAWWVWWFSFMVEERLVACRQVEGTLVPLGFDGLLWDCEYHKRVCASSGSGSAGMLVFAKWRALQRLSKHTSVCQLGAYSCLCAGASVAGPWMEPLVWRERTRSTLARVHWDRKDNSA